VVSTYDQMFYDTIRPGIVVDVSCGEGWWGAEHWWYRSPVDAGLVHDPATLRRAG